MEELWRETSELLWQRPLLWVPVLVADLLGFLVNVGADALLRSVVLSRLQFHSALGGAPMRAPVTAAAVQHANLLAGLITIPAGLLRLLLYAAALMATVAIVRGIAAREKNLFSDIGPALGRNAGSVLSLSLRALAICAVVAVLSNALVSALVKHGHQAALATGWPEFGLGVLRVALLAWLLAPIAVPVAAKPFPAALKVQARTFAFGLGVLSLLLASFITANLRAAHTIAPAARYALEFTGSWIAALPYAVLFVALARIALKAEKQANSYAGHDEGVPA